MKLHRFKGNVFRVIERARGNDRQSRIFDKAVISLILLNMAATILESYSEIHRLYGREFEIFEGFSVFIFSVEYLLRIWTADLKYPEMPAGKARVRFMLTPLAIVDLLAVLPYFIPIFFHPDLRILRALRLTRMLRVVKLNRYSRAFEMVSGVLRDKRTELSATLFVAMVLLVVASSLMFFLEHEAQPEAFPNIVETLWWGVATLTTVGYGDVVPHTGLGRLLSSMIALLGIGIVALPTGILSAGFLERVKSQKKKEEIAAAKFCPHCGEKLPHGGGSSLD